MAASRISILVLFLIFSCALASSAAVSYGPRLGGWQPIKNVNDPKIQDLAKFALIEHNKLRGASLQLIRVVKGEMQVVAGMNYKLILAASSNGKSGNYEAVVWVKPWENFRNLTSFRSV